MVKPRKLPYVWLIEWEDSFCDNDKWASIKKWKCTPAIASTIGFIIFEDKDRIALVQNISLVDDDMRGIMVIPKGTIIKRRRIKV